jgi:outer membrane protein assembly factor BamB
VVNGLVYFGSRYPDFTFYALNAVTGELIWKFGPDDFLASPTVFHGVVYAAGLGSYPPVGGRLWALDATSGNELWEYQFKEDLIGSPAVANGIVYIGSDDDKLYALKADTGVLLWSYSTGGFIVSSPEVANGVVYIASDDSNLYALDAATGAKLWSHPLSSGPNYSSPVVVNGTVYVGSEDSASGYVYAFHLPN